MNIAALAWVALSLAGTGWTQTAENPTPNKKAAQSTPPPAVVSPLPESPAATGDSYKPVKSVQPQRTAGQKQALLAKRKSWETRHRAWDSKHREKEATHNLEERMRAAKVDSREGKTRKNLEDMRKEAKLMREQEAAGHSPVPKTDTSKQSASKH